MASSSLLSSYSLPTPISPLISPFSYILFSGSCFRVPAKYGGNSSTHIFSFPLSLILQGVPWIQWKGDFPPPRACYHIRVRKGEKETGMWQGMRIKCKPTGMSKPRIPCCGNTDAGAINFCHLLARVGDKYLRSAFLPSVSLTVNGDHLGIFVVRLCYWDVEDEIYSDVNHSRYCI